MVAEVLDARDAEDGSGLLDLDGAALGERFAGVEEALGDLAVLTPRRDDQDDPVPLGRGPGHGPARRDGFVVGMGVEDHERAGHASMLARPGGRPEKPDMRVRDRR